MLDRNRELSASLETAPGRLRLFDVKLEKPASPDRPVQDRGKTYRDPDDNTLVWTIGGDLIKFVAKGDQPRYVQEGEPEGFISQNPGPGGILPPKAVLLVRDRRIRRSVVAKKARFDWGTIVEARTLASFQHPNVVTIYDLAVTNPDKPSFDGLYFITEYLEQGHLLDWVEKKRSLEEVAAVVDQVAAGVSYINSEGYVYGDLKPLNILFGEHGAKICDVELSVKFDKNGVASGIGFYSYHYAPPEQKNGTLSLRTDVYSFAAVVFDILHDEFESKGKSDRDEFCGKDKSLIPLKREFQAQFNSRPGLHRRLSKLLSQALAEKVSSRQSSVKILNNQIQKIFLEVLRQVEIRNLQRVF